MIENNSQVSNFSETTRRRNTLVPATRIALASSQLRMLEKPKNKYKANLTLNFKKKARNDAKTTVDVFCAYRQRAGNLVIGNI